MVTWKGATSITERRRPLAASPGRCDAILAPVGRNRDVYEDFFCLFLVSLFAFRKYR